MFCSLVSINMERRELPVLSQADDVYVDQLAAGLRRSAARVYVYLWLRSLDDDIETAPATQTAIQVGTGLSRKSIQDGIQTLEARGLAESKRVNTSNPGRPPNAWTTTEPLSAVLDRVFDQHGTHLLDQALTISDAECAAVDSTTDERATAVQTTDQETITVGLNWHPNGLQLPLFAARQNDHYSDRGLCVEFLAYNGSRQAVDAVVSGAATVGISGAATVTRARANGMPVVPIATLFQRPMVVFYTVRQRFGDRLDTVDQLSGRRVGMPVPSEMSTLGKMFLAQAGILEEVEIVHVEGEEHDALTSGDVDAVTGIFADPQRLDSASTTVDTLPVAAAYPIYGPTLIACEESLDRRRELLTRFLSGTTAGWAAATHDPGQAVDHLSERTDHSPERVRAVFERAVEEFASTDELAKHGWGWQTPETWNRLETALEQTDLLVS